MKHDQFRCSAETVQTPAKKDAGRVLAMRKVAGRKVPNPAPVARNDVVLEKDVALQMVVPATAVLMDLRDAGQDSAGQDSADRDLADPAAGQADRADRIRNAWSKMP